MNIYYWKNIKWLTNVNFSDDKSLGCLPKKSDFKKDWVKLPIKITYDKSDNIDGNLAIVFDKLNLPGNPMETHEKQEWIRKNLFPHPHTSMSVGDVVQIGNKYYLALSIGWKKMRW